jgi:hypothetical protein
MDDMGRVLARVCAIDLPRGNYRMFSAPLQFNAFLVLLERLQPRTRVPLWFGARLAIAGAAIGKRLHLLPDKLSDQLMTFLYKDEHYLLGHLSVPGISLRACDDVAFFSGP